MQKILKNAHTYIALLTLAALLRVTLTIQGWTKSSSDEAVMNLMALHIAYHGELPIFFYGQHYLGGLEAYIGAVLFHIFSPSVLVMRLEMIGFYILFLAMLYLLTSKLYSRNFGLLILALLILGSPKTLNLQMEAVGYPELPFLATSLFFVAYMIAQNKQKSLIKNAMLYLLWGFVAGVALWGHALTAPYVLVSFSLIALWQWRNIIKFGVWFFIAGFVAGAFPLLWYNVHAAPGQDTLTNVLAMTQLGQETNYNFWAHIGKTFFISIPVATGFWSQCLAQGNTTLHGHCAVEQSIWGGGYAILFFAAIIMTLLGWKHAHKDNRDEAIKQSARFLLLFAALFVIISFIRGAAPVFSPIEERRYLICTWVSLPAILWPLWSQRFHIAKTIIFALICLVLLHSTIMTFAEIPQAQTDQTQLGTLSQTLQEQGITRFYSEYWTCNYLIFLSQEKLICADTWVINGKISHGLDRYTPYREMVESAKNTAFIYPNGDAHIADIEQALKSKGISFATKSIAGYAVIIPSSTFAF
jgi:hypothetical protein